jgi:restriction endonuclease S subunit
VQQSISEDTRVALPKINQAALAKLLVPVPPLAEQHRITAKVEELMTLCARLEAQLNIACTESRRLLEAILEDARNSSKTDDHKWASCRSRGPSNDVFVFFGWMA